MKKKWVITSVSIILFLGLLYYTSVFRITANFHVVDEGKFYRSAQLTRNELKEYVKKYGIKTVISLRGFPDAISYEKEVLEELGVKFIYYGFATEYYPRTENLREYLQSIKTEQYPILVHCRNGADRTSEASALYALEVMGQSKEEVLKNHMGFKYWHVPFFQPSKTSFIQKYQGYDWAMSQYDECAPEFADYRHPRANCSK